MISTEYVDVFQRAPSVGERLDPCLYECCACRSRWRDRPGAYALRDRCRCGSIYYRWVNASEVRS